MKEPSSIHQYSWHRQFRNYFSVLSCTCILLCDYLWSRRNQYRTAQHMSFISIFWKWNVDFFLEFLLWYPRLEANADLLDSISVPKHDVISVGSVHIKVNLPNVWRLCPCNSFHILQSRIIMWRRYYVISWNYNKLLIEIWLANKTTQIEVL